MSQPPSLERLFKNIQGVTALLYCEQASSSITFVAKGFRPLNTLRRISIPMLNILKTILLIRNFTSLYYAWSDVVKRFYPPHHVPYIWFLALKRTILICQKYHSMFSGVKYTSKSWRRFCCSVARWLLTPISVWHPPGGSLHRSQIPGDSE